MKEQAECAFPKRGKGERRVSLVWHVSDKGTGKIKQLSQSVSLDSLLYKIVNPAIGARLINFFITLVRRRVSAK